MNLWNNKFSPMLLKEIADPFNSKDYIYELKYDGIRCLIYVDPNNIKLISRNQIDITYLYPELNIIKSIVKNKVIFDGEIICTKEGKPSFSNLQKRSRLKQINKINNQVNNNPVTFICFDILYQDKDLTNLNLLKRKEILNKYPNNEYFIKTNYIENNGIELFELIKKNNLEGIVAKEKNSIYEINKRSTSWLKIKNFIKEEFYIGGYFYNNTHVFIALLGELSNNKLIFVGKIFIPKKNKLFTLLKSEKTIKSKFINHQEDNINYVLPKYKVLVKYIERTNNNNLRQPFYVGDNNE